VQVTLVGLGRMGGNMVRRLALGGHDVIAVDPSEAARSALDGIDSVRAMPALGDAIAAADSPRTVWLMLPSGAVTEGALGELAELLSAGDVVVDGGNADYRDSQRRAATLAERDIHFADVGVSGGVWGLQEGYGLMAGGAPEDVEQITPLLRTLAPAPDHGWVHAGPVGAGHFTKMVHNGIEYGLMQALAEGIALLSGRSDLVSDVAGVAEAWRYGTVIRSWLLDLTAEVLRDEARLDEVAPVVADSGEGRWTVRESIDTGIPTPVITAALMERFSSQGRSDVANRVLAMMRNSFGGHPVTLSKPGASSS
jgi:6-phosphogluconate dehydrogenase